MVYNYRTTGTCAKEIQLEIETDKSKENGEKIIGRVQFTGGCGGNTRGIASLVSGMEVSEAVKKLKGITCGTKKTSCPDQLSSALELAAEALDGENTDGEPDYIKNYNKWVNYSGLDQKTKAALAEIKGDEDKIKEYFIAPLEFGTGGLRGIMRPGINSMNIYTVRQATQGMANLIKAEKLEENGAVIAYDSRNNSELFAKEAAKVLAANKIKVYIFDDIRPTPELSFALRYLNCAAGINITASHNPKEYNGYKAYWSDGAQLPPDHAETVSDAINKTDIFTGVLSCHYGEAVKLGRIKIIGGEIDEEYIRNVMEQSVYPDIIKKAVKNNNFKIVYTPLHGAGYKLIPEVFSRTGLDFTTVKKQMNPDGNFPTVKYPNPEYLEVFELGIEDAKRENCDLIIATDPDADRTGIAVRDKKGEYITLTGNQVGAMLLEYIITARKENKTLKSNACAVKTIVTTELAAKICEENGVKIINVLTGFKFIGEKIKQFEEDKTESDSFLFGYEESYGYLSGTYARDKDAVFASMLIAEMAAYYKANKNMTLTEVMENIYKKYGYYGEDVQNIAFTGVDGQKKMRDIMDGMRKDPPKNLAGYKILSFRDYKTSEIKDFRTGKISPAGLPKSDVLYFDLENGTKVVIRPSGTEPKIKIYYLVSAKDSKDSGKQSESLKEAMSGYVS
ncbi:MAG: TIGR03905 family TSCPD domain-containing protein [Oscillospiraceae bacterium]|nr:TIGR03905 family TSCPD domain-containing protein [Oscillospiraceae bacterium]